MQIFIVFLSRVNLSIFLSDFLPAQPLSRKIVGTIMFINCVLGVCILEDGGQYGPREVSPRRYYR